MCPDPDLVPAFRCPYRKFDPPPGDLGHLGLADHPPPDRRRGEVADIDRGADRAFAGVEKAPDCIQRRVLHHHDHDRGGQYRRQHCVLEPVRQMLGLDEQGERTAGSERYRFHRTPFRRE
jgi:hypothetical protein